MLPSLVSLLLLAPVSIEVRVDGEGYLRFAREGRAVYAKQARLVVTNGRLAHESGPPVLPSIQIPNGVQSLNIDLEGRVLGAAGNEQREWGRLVLARFAEGQGPLPGDGLLVAAHRPELGSPGEGTFGVVRVPERERPARTPARTPAPRPRVTQPAADQPAPVPAQPAAQTPPKPESPPAVQATAEPVPAPPSEEFLRSGGVQINLRAMTEVSTDVITIGQIGDVFAKADAASRIANLEFTRTPLIGVEVVVDRSRLVSRLRLAGFDAARVIIVGPADAKLRRKGQLVTHARFEEFAIGVATERLGPSARLASMTQAPDLIAPSGSLQLVAESFSSNGGRVSVNVAVFVDGRRFNSRTIQLANHAPVVSLRNGQMVKARIQHGGAVVVAQARVKSVDVRNNVVTVETDTGAVLRGVPAEGGIVEVSL